MIIGVIIFHGLNRPGSFSRTLGWVFAALVTITVGNLVWSPLTLRHPGVSFHLVGALASVKAIADGCGAAIQVRSEVGKGTTFRLTFNGSVVEPARPARS